MIPNSIYRDITIAEAEKQPSKTFRLDPVTKRVAGIIDGREAVQQMCLVVLNIERFSRVPLSPRVGREFDNLFGQNHDFISTVLEARISEALTADDRIESVDGFDVTHHGDVMNVEFNINTYYGVMRRNVGVQL